MIRRFWRKLIWLLWPLRPVGRSARVLVAGIMLIMAFGRFGLYQTSPLPNSLTNDQYGILLLLFGGLTLATTTKRLAPQGRIVAAFGASLMAGLGYDVGVWGVTRLIEWWMALFLAGEVFAIYDD